MPLRKKMSWSVWLSPTDRYSPLTVEMFVICPISAFTHISDLISILDMVQRITYRRRLSYNTKSNKRKVVRTPGGKLVFQYLKKRPSVPKCPMTGMKLKGVKPATNQEKARMSRRQKTVFRAYGGVLSHKAVREKIVRAFLIEEQKIVMKVLKAQGKN